MPGELVKLPVYMHRRTLYNIYDNVVPAEWLTDPGYITIISPARKYPFETD
jgi:hypothetical protein